MKRKGKVVMFALLICLMLTLSIDEGYTAAKRVKLTLWSYKQLSAEPWLNALAERVNKHFPNVELKMAFKPMEKFHQLFRVALTSRTGPDLLHTWGGEATLKDFARMDSFLALNDYFPKDKFENTRGIKSGIVNGKIYGINVWGRTAGMIYNKKIFKELGLDPESFPRKWDEFIRVCETLKKAGVEPISYANKEGYCNEWWFNYLRPQSYDSEEEMIRLNFTTYADEGTYAALAHYKELWEKGYFIRGGMSMPNDLYYEQLLGERTAMELLFLDGYYEAKKKFGEGNVGFAPFPVFGDGKLAEVIALDTNFFTITSWCKYPKEAVEVVGFVTNEENSHLVFKTMGEMCANKKTVDVPEDPVVRSVFEQIYKASTIYAYEYLPSPVWEAMLRHVTSYLLGDETKEDVAKAFDKEAKRWREKLGIKE